MIQMTNETREMLAEHLAHWRKLCLSTEPIEEAATKEIIERIHVAAGYEAPTRIEVLPSPTACRDAKRGAGIFPDLRDVAYTPLEERMARSVNETWMQEGVIRLVQNNLTRPLLNNIQRGLLQTMLDVTGANTEPAFEFCAGAWWCFTEAGYNAYREMGVKYEDGVNEGLDMWIEHDRRLHWWIPTKQVAYVSQRPEVVRLDEQDRLHGEEGPALRYVDGQSVYAWHGLVIPRDWIEHKDKLSAETALTWDNIEQRRAACEILGWHNVLRKVGATVVDRDADEQIGTLLVATLPDVGEEYFLHVRCGTGREFAIPVPQCTTAREANAWTYGLAPEELKPEVRT